MVELVEVGPRDGYQSIAQFIPTETKIDFVRRAAAAGLRRIEIGSFVNPKVLPQLADTADVLAACADVEDLLPQVLVPNKRYGRIAVEAGARFLAFVISVSASHSRSNVRQHPLESVDEYQRLNERLSSAIDMRLNIATAFDCPFENRVSPAAVIALLDRVIPLRPGAEICLCDTTGRATPDQVAQLFIEVMRRYPKVTRWAMHAHDTYGLGLANVVAAYRMGVRVFDAAFAGLGGCPFAPGAKGNVATEDVAWMFNKMGVETGVDFDRLILLANDAAQISGGSPGGRVRDAMRGMATVTRSG
jgi:hydroxymethylglutaryl-CoA lyase